MLLSTISVSPQAQGQGVGRQLLQEVEAWAAESGAAFVYLTTDRDANVEVNGFYQRNGYVLESTLKKSGNRIMNRYIKRLR
nr:GNAT family N-acetyltransferase [Pseudomonas sp. BIGb0427]